MSKLLLLVEYTAKQGKRATFLDEVEASGILEKIYSEEGFLTYHYYLDTADENIILLVEEWESEDHQQKHIKASHMTQLMTIKEKYIVSTSIKKVLVP